MKKTILFFTVSVLLYSCSNPENDIRRYLEKKNAPELNSLEFIEVSDIDSVYSPFNELLSASVWCSHARFALSKAVNEFAEHNFQEKVTMFEDSLKDEYNRVAEILSNAERVLNFKNFNLEMDGYNGVGVKAEYRINGNKRTDWFYYGKDGKVQSSTIDIEKYYREITECLSGYDTDIREYKRSWY